MVSGPPPVSHITGSGAPDGLTDFGPVTSMISRPSEDDPSLLHLWRRQQRGGDAEVDQHTGNVRYRGDQRRAGRSRVEAEAIQQKGKRQAYQAADQHHHNHGERRDQCHEQHCRYHAHAKIVRTR